jgi:hypothetical protein
VRAALQQGIREGSKNIVAAISLAAALWPIRSVFYHEVIEQRIVNIPAEVFLQVPPAAFNTNGPNPFTVLKASRDLIAVGLILKLLRRRVRRFIRRIGGGRFAATGMATSSINMMILLGMDLLYITG